MIERHKKEEWEMLKAQLTDQQEIIKKLMETTQAAQMKQLEAKQDRESKALNSQQAKASVETAKEVANDKTLRTKGEKDRRLREKKQNNIKRFMEEKKVCYLFIYKFFILYAFQMCVSLEFWHQAGSREREAQGDPRQTIERAARRHCQGIAIAHVSSKYPHN